MAGLEQIQAQNPNAYKHYLENQHIDNRNDANASNLSRVADQALLIGNQRQFSTIPA
jgi:hypothetical protein